MKRSSTAIWNSSIADVGGSLSATDTFIFSAMPGLPSSLEASSAEQLLAAAHTRCFSTMLSDAMAQGRGSPEKLKVAASLILDNIVVRGWSITNSHLVFIGKIPGAKVVPVEEIAARGQEDSPSPRSFDVPKRAVGPHLL